MKRLILIIWLLMTGSVIADSIQGRTDAGTVTLNNARDSAQVIFFYPDNNPYDTISFFPRWDSVTADRFLISLDDIYLDSIGCHAYLAKGFGSSGTWLDTLQGQWCNFGAIAVEPGSGYKTYPCTLYVGKTSDESAIAGVSVTVRPLGGGTPFALRLTDANGLFYYNSDAESISVYLHKQGVNTNAEDTLVITGSQTDTILVPLFGPSQPPADQTTIFTWILTPGGDTLSPSYLSYQLVDSTGGVFDETTKITYGSGSNQVLIMIGEIEVTTDSSLFSFSLFANANLSISSSKYKFKARYLKDGRRYLNTEFIVAVPVTDNFNPFAQ